MLEKIFSKKILDAQIVKISDDTENVFEIANQVIEFENNYPNKKNYQFISNLMILTQY